MITHRGVEKEFPPPKMFTLWLSKKLDDGIVSPFPRALNNGLALILMCNFECYVPIEEIGVFQGKIKEIEQKIY